jgi:hypothetical protein
VLAVLVLAASAVAVAAAEPPSLGEADRGAIRDIIARQIEAFRRDDGEAAFAFASPTIQGMFRTPGHFMEMVRQSYRPVYRPHDVQFEELVTLEGKTMQRVLLVGPDQDVVVALYEMQRLANGEWRINGCFLFAAQDKAT